MTGLTLIVEFYSFVNFNGMFNQADGTMYEHVYYTTLNITDASFSNA
jgi:hypothetical protein